jgi:hypothetical protein
MQPDSPVPRGIARGLVMILAACAFQRVASADVLTHSTSIPLSSTNWSHVALLPRFNTALGTLEGVSVSLSGHIEGTARYENLDQSSATITINFTADLKVRRPDTNAVLLSSTPAFHQVDQAAAFDGTIDFAGPSGETLSTISSTANSTFVPPFPLNAMDQALFVGAGNAVFTASATGLSSGMGSGNLIVGFTQLASAVLSVTYTYTPPFIQDCNNNGIVDSQDIAAHTSPDCNLNDIPDECELLGNDCNDNGIPDECDLATGVLTDLNGDGFPDQCTCVRVDRVKPASLVLWPEFDSRPGQITLLSLSNTNRNYINGFVRVEFVYIDGQTCLETNRTAQLTPNDTITVVSWAHQGGTNRGYAYAFACSPSGVPISYNFLIGSEIVLDGLEALDYGMNAFTWRALPPVRQPTDLDNDGIRDLNGLEYEPSPDVIMIPRFLGQNATTHGSLLLVALSGGLQFTTTVDLQIFNDNEDPFSAQYTFRCWAKVPLLEISNMFSNSMLHASEDDPNEVLGDPATEAGWLRLDGRIATSSVTTIVDPAFLAVLVENRGLFSASALPWELCTQTNGDLLPLGLLGDTSP